MFRIFIFISLEYIFVESQESNLWAIQSSKDDIRTDTVHAVQKTNAYT